MPYIYLEHYFPASNRANKFHEMKRKDKTSDILEVLYYIGYRLVELRRTMGKYFGMSYKTMLVVLLQKLVRLEFRLQIIA